MRRDVRYPEDAVERVQLGAATQQQLGLAGRPFSIDRRRMTRRAPAGPEYLFSRSQVRLMGRQVSG
jgi:hypothetical protein